MEIKQKLCRVEKLCRSFKIKALTLSTISAGMRFYQVLQQSFQSNLKIIKNIGLFRHGRIKYTKNKYIKPKNKNKLKLDGRTLPPVWMRLFQSKRGTPHGSLMVGPKAELLEWMTFWNAGILALATGLFTD